MPPIKLQDKCDDCKQKIKKFSIYQNKTLCGKCYRRHFIIIPGLPKIFNEPLDCPIGFSVTLTRSQKKTLDERVKSLFPNSKKCCRVKYLRALILGDIEHWKNERELKGRV